MAAHVDLERRLRSPLQQSFAQDPGLRQETRFELAGNQMKTRQGAGRLRRHFRNADRKWKRVRKEVRMFHGDSGRERSAIRESKNGAILASGRYAVFPRSPW